MAITTGTVPENVSIALSNLADACKTWQIPHQILPDGSPRFLPYNSAKASSVCEIINNSDHIYHFLTIFTMFGLLGLCSLPLWFFAIYRAVSWTARRLRNV